MKVMKYFVFASLLCLCACSDDNDNKNNEIPQDLVELKVDASEISIAQGDTRTVKITSGNGEYKEYSISASWIMEFWLIPATRLPVTNVFTMIMYGSGSIWSTGTWKRKRCVI